MLPTVSIITPVFNGAAFLEATIRSVLAQTYPSIEHIVMDGGSTDGTVEIARQFEGQLTLISERDEGQSDAINKGWQQASGDILAWLCADDLYEPETVAIAVNALIGNPEAGWVYGTGRSLDAEGRPRPFRHAVEPWDYERLAGVHNYVIQPSVFLRRAVVEHSGPLRNDLHYTMDYEYWLRIGRTYPGRFTPEVRVQVKRYAAAKSHSGGQHRMDELTKIMHEYGREDLPSGYRHEWATIALRSGMGSLRAGQWVQAGNGFSRLGRYPAAIPRGAVKLALEALPEPVDRQLRRWLVRDP